MHFLAIGDLHMPCDKGNGGLSKYVENGAEFVLNEVRKVLNYGLKHGITNIVFLGDIVDSPRASYESMLAFANLIKTNPNFQFYCILGNHDKKTKLYDNVGHSLEIILAMNLPNLKIYLEPTVETIDGALVNFMPWPCKAFKKDCLNIAHVEVSGSSYDSGIRKFENTKNTGTETDNQYSTSNAVSIIGHLHTAHTVRNSHYIGTLYQGNFGESLNKYFAHVEFNNVTDYSVELIPNIPEYRLHTIIISSKLDLKTIPTDSKDLIKLVIKEGSDIQLADYNHLSNVVMVKAFKNKAELTSILTEDLLSGSELVIKTSDFFNSYLENLDVAPNIKTRASKLRLKLLMDT